MQPTCPPPRACDWPPARKPHPESFDGECNTSAKTPCPLREGRGAAVRSRSCLAPAPVTQAWSQPGPRASGFRASHTGMRRISASEKYGMGPRIFSWPHLSYPSESTGESIPQDGSLDDLRNTSIPISSLTGPGMEC